MILVKYNNMIASNYIRQGRLYHYWQVWNDFRAISGALHRRAELQQLIRWATRKRLTKPLRLYEIRLKEEEARLLQYQCHSRRLTFWTQIIYWIGILIAPAPRYYRKGSAAKYRSPNPRRHGIEDADIRLHIQCIYARNRAAYLPKIQYWTGKRDALAQAGQQAAAKTAHHNAMLYADELHTRGYFVDAHRCSLLRLYGLRWRRGLLNKIVNADGAITPAHARQFLALLVKYELSYRIKCWLMLPARRRYYAQQCACLRTLLYDAIALNAPILTF